MNSWTFSPGSLGAAFALPCVELWSRLTIMHIHTQLCWNTVDGKIKTVMHSHLPGVKTLLVWHVGDWTLCIHIDTVWIKVNRWECLLTDGGRPIFIVGRTIFWVKDPSRIWRRAQAECCRPSSDVCNPTLTMDVLWSVIQSSHLCEFPTMMDCHPDLWARCAISPLSFCPII